MNNLQMSNILSSDPVTQTMFLGTFASDQLPIKLPKRFALIANTEKLSVSEGHWVAIFSRSSSVVYYFDSFGDPPRREIRRWLLQHFPLIAYNSRKQQHVDSVTCGGYGIFVLRELCSGKSFERVVRHFVSIKDDDRFIENFLRSRYRFHLSH